jgi:methionyl-tRNA formyltransferase
MLVKKSLEIGPDETAGELHDRLARLGRETMEETLQQLLNGTLSPEKQNDDETSYAPMMKKEDGRVDWSLSAQEVHDRVRGLAPWPGAFTILDGEVLKLARTEVVEGAGTAGTVIAATADGVDVACGDGVVRIGALQLPGKKMMSVADFLRGHQLAAGQKLG